MCTIVFAWQAFPDTPVAVAANRDEALDRPSEPPSIVDSDPRVLAPTDGEAGGTWIGYNEADVVVAVTNRWTDSDLPGERSRGLLVRDALRYQSAEAAVRHVEEELDRRTYEAFNLVVTDPTAALFVEYDGGVRIRNLDPGVHVVGNTGADGQYAIPRRRREHAEEQAANLDTLRAALAPDPGESAGAWLDRAGAALSDHSYGVCIHGEGFGTRSSSLLSIGSEGASYRFADGPPCETAYRPVESQI